MLFFDLSSIITRSCDTWVHRAGSQLKMSECQTKAGNQECFWKLENLKTWKLKNLKTLKPLKMILGTCWTTDVFMSMLKSHSLTLTLSYSHTLTPSHCLIHSLSTCWTSFVFISMTACMELIFGLLTKMTNWHGMRFNSVSIIPCHPLPYSYA